MQLTKHARIRMQQRGINREAVELAFAYGRAVRAKGATYIVMGRNEIQRCRRDGLELHHLDGVTLVMVDGHVVTTYRQRDFSHLRRSRRGLRSARWRKRPR